MGLSIDRPKERDVASHKITERLYRTEDGRVVGDGDPDARWLYAAPGAEIPAAEAEQLGLVKAAAAAADKAAPKQADKARRKGDGK